MNNVCRPCFLLLYSLVALTGCAVYSPKSRSCCSSEAAAVLGHRAPAIQPGESVFNMESWWLTDTGRPFQFSELRGTPCVISLFFASCSMKCPITVMNMRSVEASLPRETRDHIKFVLVTFDPADSVKILNDYRHSENLSESNWILLRGYNADVAELGRLLGFGFSRNPGGSFTHDAKITVLDRAGKIASQREGLYAGTDAICESVKNLLN